METKQTTEQAQHTPGPWAVARYSPRRFGLGQAGDGALYLIQCEYGDTSTDICRANARLIAAAPELLEALIRLLDDDDELLTLQGRRNYARTTIAKATGEQA